MNSRSKSRRSTSSTSPSSPKAAFELEQLLERAHRNAENSIVLRRMISLRLNSTRVRIGLLQRNYKLMLQTAGETAPEMKESEREVAA